MKLLAWRGLTATCGVLLAAALHPALSRVWNPPLASISALALLLVAGLLAGPRDPAGRLVGVGAFAVALAIGYDGLRGHRGTLTLEPEQGTQSFEEDGPDGRSLGLRPLGYGVVLERVDPVGGAVLKAGDEATIAVRPGRAASHGGFRFGVSAHRGAAEPSALRIAVAGPQGSSVVEVHTGAPVTADGRRPRGIIIRAHDDLGPRVHAVELNDAAERVEPRESTGPDVRPHVSCVGCQVLELTPHAVVPPFSEQCRMLA